MEGAAEAEFQDWVVLLHDSNAVSALTAAELSREKSIHFGGIEGESDSVSLIKSDYFSLDNQERRAKTVPVPVRNLSEEEGLVESDNPCWIDPCSENRYGRDNSGELWSDSDNDRSDERKLREFDSKTESGNVEFVIGDEELSGRIQKLESLESHESKISGYDPDLELAFKEFDEIRSQSKDLSNSWSDSCGDNDQNGSKVVESLESHESKISGSDLDQAFKEFDEIQSQSKDLSKLWYDSCGDVDQNVSKVELEEGKEHLEENKNLQVEETKVNTESGSEVGDKRKVVWWKVPFEVLKYYMFKASPVWSFSVAAAVMGFIILGRRLYKMKRKSQRLHLKVILDEKKGSPFMVRAARLNEAFSVVRRVPIVRPALPASGINPWPAMGMS